MTKVYQVRDRQIEHHAPQVEIMILIRSAALELRREHAIRHDELRDEVLADFIGWGQACFLGRNAEAQEYLPSSPPVTFAVCGLSWATLPASLLARAGR
ncbi:MAG: hypothetical protein JO166_04580 [Deltaproteobacteria bacterium]|nr:hypothetical protein [Deltaproteobacteria bacterium]